jgi:hypothetical protein
MNDKLKRNLERLKKNENSLDQSVTSNINLSHYFKPEFLTYKNGNLNVVALALSDQLDGFIVQVSTNINKLEKSDRLDMLDKLKKDIETRLSSVIV